MKKITKIERSENTVVQAEKTRVAAYCRVSTGSDEQLESLEEYDEQLVRKMIEKIIVYDDRFAIEFKSGTSIDIERNRRKNFIAP